MTEIYKFRKMEHLLGEEFKELERQSLYFARPRELNDPLESHLDFMWDGDAIIWANLFRHYINCLSRAWWLVHFAGSLVYLRPEDVPWLVDRVALPPSVGGKRLDKVCNEVFAGAGLDTFSGMLADRTGVVTRDELQTILRHIHHWAVNALFDEFPDQISLTQNPNEESDPGPVHVPLPELLNYRQTRARLRPEYWDIEIDYLNRQMSQLSEGIDLRYRLNHPQGHNAEFLMYDFTKSYVIHSKPVSIPDLEYRLFRTRV